jgi:hypothetical protein
MHEIPRAVKWLLLYQETGKAEEYQKSSACIDTVML